MTNNNYYCLFDYFSFLVMIPLFRMSVFNNSKVIDRICIYLLFKELSINESQDTYKQFQQLAKFMVITNN